MEINESIVYVKGSNKMPQQSRYKPEEKHEIVIAIQTGNASIGGSAKKYGIDKSTVRSWIRLYETRGIEGLRPSEVR